MVLIFQEQLIKSMSFVRFDTCTCTVDRNTSLKDVRAKFF